VACKRYGISDTAFYKWCKKYNIPTPIRPAGKRAPSVKRERSQVKHVVVVKSEGVIEGESDRMSLAQRTDPVYLLERVKELNEECNELKRKYETLSKAKMETEPSQEIRIVLKFEKKDKLLIDVAMGKVTPEQLMMSIMEKVRDTWNSDELPDIP
jgi:transposase-like protein